MTEHLPRLVVTGASGFTGRHLLDAIKHDYRIFGLARRSQARARAPVHENISWDQVDVGDRPHLTRVFERIGHGGGADIVIHLAAHYDFTGEDHPEYWRTNVDGMRNVLEGCKVLGPKLVVFASSVAACEFPKPGDALTESSAADGRVTYAVTKRIGEEMLREYRGHFPSCIVRFAAMFSDWCEYPPLFMFLSKWLSDAWDRKILGGAGEFGIPYLHVGDAVRIITRILDRAAAIEPGEVFIASPDGSIPVRALFEAATAYERESPEKYLYLPRPVCALGMLMRDMMGQLTGNRPFERPWMARYIDRQLTVDANRTRSRLEWEPRQRLLILRRMPFLLENRRADALRWHRVNRAAMKRASLAVNLRIHNLLARHEEQIVRQNVMLLEEGSGEKFKTYRKMPADEMGWNSRVAVQNLRNAILARDKGIFISYCRAVARRRLEHGYDGSEVIAAFRTMSDICQQVLRSDPEAEDIQGQIGTQISMTTLFGCDQIEDVFDSDQERQMRRICPIPAAEPDASTATTEPREEERAQQ